jgi:hypothetical protein
VVERYVPVEEFRGVLENAPAGVFSQEIWEKWHERLGMSVPRPCRVVDFPMDRLAPKAGGFFGR